MKFFKLKSCFLTLALTIGLAVAPAKAVDAWPFLAATISGVQAGEALDDWVSGTENIPLMWTIMRALFIPAAYTALFSAANTHGFPVKNGYESRKKLAVCDALTCAAMYGTCRYLGNVPLNVCLVETLLLWKAKDSLNHALLGL